MKNLNRRNFISRSLVFGAAAASGPFAGLVRSIAEAAPVAHGPGGPHFFVLIHGSGAMDATCGLDPQVLPKGATEKDLFVEYTPEQIFRSGQLGLAPGAKPLYPFAPNIAVINGVVMSSDKSDPGHDVSGNYIISGRNGGLASPLSFELAHDYGLSPFGVMYAKNSGILSIDRGLRSGLLTDASAQSGNSSSFYGAEVNASVAGGQFAQSVDLNTDYGQTLKEYSTAAKFRPAYLETLGALQTAHQNMAPEILATASAFSLGASRSALFFPQSNAQVGFDTHSDHVKNHLQSQVEFFQYVADCFTIFESIPVGSAGKNLFDCTTFMVTSEFSRTPALNSNRGKDHNQETNSVLLAGRGVAGGQSVGKSVLLFGSKYGSSPRHVGAPFDFKTGKTANFQASPEELKAIHDRSDLVRPENVAVTVRRIFGISETDFNPAFVGVKPIASVVKA